MQKGLRIRPSRATAPRHARYRRGSRLRIPASPIQLLPSGWAAGLCTGRWIGSSSRRRSRCNSPACHPQNAVHSRGKGICTMPHLFCGTQWRRPHAGPSRRGANLSLPLSLSRPPSLTPIPLSRCRRCPSRSSSATWTIKRPPRTAKGSIESGVSATGRR